MFDRLKKESKYDRPIRRTLTEMETFDPGGDDYGILLDRLNKLHKMREEDRPNRVDPNTALTVAANIVGIGIIVKYEQLAVITTKALGFIMKPR